MLGLQALRDVLSPPVEPDPASELLEIAKTFVGKRRTADQGGIPLDGLQVDPDYQRPPDRDKIRELVAHLKQGGKLPAIKVNERPDGSRWITDGQHRAAAAAICGHDRIDATVTHVEQHQEPQETNIVAKVAEVDEGDAITRLLGAGGRRDGKRLVLKLGRAGTVTYLPRDEWVSKTERGQLTVEAQDARMVLDRLGLSELSLENGGSRGASTAETP